ncbi:hypothetical protein QFC19_004823 [Naganishia cerealis]|uniref:Uncharacterized protein n=1 Tax=Naganishia cerealis TaxID=610337 RepID=A0ACC2VT51_9TREE|nr:hypothetical protein QFC19_004823 [Naganishia cerealis]
MPALTKKQQKAQAFKSGKGKKDREEPADLPEQDLLPDEDEPAKKEDGQESADYKAKSKSKKSKEKKLKEKLAKEGAEDSQPKGKSEKAKGKEKEIVKDGEEPKTGEAETEEGKKGKKTKKDIKQRFILFVGTFLSCCSARFEEGHMSYDTTAAGLAAHFEKEIGSKPSVRLLTTKGTPATMYHKASESRSRGIAFVEFPTSGALQAGLRLHHTELDGKLINVELTAGGGGGKDERKQKIQERNDRIGEQRKRKRAADGTEDGDAKEGGGEAGAGEEEGSDKKKARGGRRGKKTGEDTAANPPVAPEDDPRLSGWAARKVGTFATEGTAPPPSRNGGSGGFGGRSGRGQSGGRGGSRGGRGGGRGGGGDRRKWEPTGANAMVVG